MYYAAVKLCSDGESVNALFSPPIRVSFVLLPFYNIAVTDLITDWSELGGSDAQIVLIGREAGRGTRDGFESITGTEGSCEYRQELTSIGAVITAVSNNPDAIGYASLASVKDSVKAVSVGGVTPGDSTVKDGSYVVQRPFVLVTKTDAELSEAAQKFLDFATSGETASLISGAGVVPAK